MAWEPLTSGGVIHKILDTAENAEEALMVYREISDIESDIEVLKGQIKYMEESAAMSSVTLRINTIRPNIVTVASKWSLIDVIKDSFESLLDFGKGIVEFIVRFVIVGIPSLIIIAVPVSLLVMLVKYLVRKSKSKKSSSKPELFEDVVRKTDKQGTHRE